MTFGGKDNRGPSIAELQRFVREQAPMLFMLSNGTDIIGQLRWFDDSAFQIVPMNGEQPFTILRSAVVGYRKHGSGGAAQTAAKQAAVAAAAVSSTESASPKETQSSKESEIRADDIGGN